MEFQKSDWNEKSQLTHDAPGPDLFYTHVFRLLAASDAALRWHRKPFCWWRQRLDSPDDSSETLSTPAATTPTQRGLRAFCSPATATIQPSAARWK